MKPVSEKSKMRARAQAKYDLRVQITKSNEKINWLLDQWKENFSPVKIKIINGQIIIDLKVKK